MITYLNGAVVECGPLRAVIDVGGLGYEVLIPITTAEKIPAIGQTVKLHTVVIYREDAHTLYGFATRDERDFFKLLVEKVSGIGPKIALTMLSKLSIVVLKRAIANADIALLAQCPGIGKKTAERLVIELKDKLQAQGSAAFNLTLSDAAVAPMEPMESMFSDAVAALVALGYKAPDADKAARKALSLLPETQRTTESLIKLALN